MNNHRKPRLLFLRFTRPDLPAFVLLHLQEQVLCLSQFFDVTVINYPCDYRKLCDIYEPDIVIFESGTYVGERDVKNVSAYPEIPKLGFIHCDAYCVTRQHAICDMARWGITNFFTNSVSLGSYTPAIAERLFVWPNFINPDIYHDYGLPKVIPVLFTGSQQTQYPWRNRINKIISQHYPSLQSPHFGWRGREKTGFLFGESYARLINAAYIAPTCGSIANDVVRKHFEIPACNTCLITQRTASIEAAGFSDLLNCVFVDDVDVVKKLDWLFQRPDELERITRAGREFVESHHAIRNRDQVFQWYKLHKQLKQGQKIVQLGPFLPLTITEQSSRIRNVHIMSRGIDKLLMAQGDEKLRSGHYDEAEILYRKCINYHKVLMSEPILRLALCYLYMGNPGDAIAILSRHILRGYWKVTGAEPDPVEWAYFIVAFLCQGQISEAVVRANQFSALRNKELDRVREVVRLLSNQRLEVNADQCKVSYRSSVHQLPQLIKDAWLDSLLTMLTASRQTEMVERLARSSQILNVIESIESELTTQGDLDTVRILNHRTRAKRWLNQHFDLPLPWLYFKRLFCTRARVWSIRHCDSTIMKSLRLLRTFKERIGHFLPYKWSAMSREKDLLTIQRFLVSEDIRSGLLLGAADRVWLTEAFLAGMNENPNLPFAVCMNYSTSRFMKLQKRLAGKAWVRCEYISEQNGLLEEQNEGFGVAVIDCSELGKDLGNHNIPDADLIILDDINVGSGFVLFQGLLDNQNYVLIEHELSHCDGFAIFRKLIRIS
jgi:hypothetical protein